MAKIIKGNSFKVSFGKKKPGRARKTFNRHDNKGRTYRGQGR